MVEFVEKVIQTSIVESVIILVVSFIIYNVIKKIIDKRMKKKIIRTKKDGKKATYIKLFHNTLKYIILIITALLLLQVNGVNVNSLLTGLGIAGIVAGLALQDALKDIIMGTNIITDDFFVVGDVINYNGIEGKVLAIGLKCTKIEDINTKNIVSITNRNIEKIINVSDWLDIDIPVSYDEKTTRIEKVLTQLASEIKKNENVKDCQYLGINDFENSSVIYKIRIFCKPENKPTINRFARRCIKITFDENNIRIPYTQIDIHSIK